jgi:DNA-binding transcriptional MerR regulator
MDTSLSNIYLIKDLARLTGFSIYTLKFYLKIGLFQEVGRSPETRFRYFNDSTIEKLKKIRELRRQAKSIKEIKDELL